MHENLQGHYAVEDAPAFATDDETTVAATMIDLTGAPKGCKRKGSKRSR